MLKIFEMFAGYGTATFALKELNLDFECVGFSEIDKFAVKIFVKNHTKEFNHGSYSNLKIPKNYGDATKINPEELPDFNLLTAGFPCQAFSIAGKGRGELDMRGTLFYEIIRIAEEKKPDYMLLENVKGLTNKRHKTTFEKILSELKRIGYYVHVQILNSKDYGVPQNRERVWFVCFREKAEFDRFIFPEKQELKIFLKDILESEIDEKYFLNEKKIKRLLKSDDLKKKFSSLSPNIAISMMARQYANWKGNHILQVNNANHFNNRVYSIEGISPVLRTPSGGNSQPFILENFKIRKLTPKECFRLQGFLKDQINLEGISDSQKYKLAGNGQTLSVVQAIFREIFK